MPQVPCFQCVELGLRPSATVREFLKTSPTSRNTSLCGTILPMSSVFLCHSSADKELVRRIAKDLLLAGVRVWLDEAEFLIGDPLLSKIASAIKQMQYLAVVMTRNSIHSRWVAKELEIAMSDQLAAEQVKVLPLRADDCEIPAFLQGIYYVDIGLANYEAGIKHLLDRVAPGTSHNRATPIAIGPDAYSWVRNPSTKAKLTTHDIETRLSVLDGAMNSAMFVPLVISMCACEELPTARRAYLKLTEAIDAFKRSDIFDEEDEEDFGQNLFVRYAEGDHTYEANRVIKFLNLYFESHRLPRSVVDALPRCFASEDKQIRLAGLYCAGSLAPDSLLEHLVSCAMTEEDDLVREVSAWGVANLAANNSNDTRVKNTLLLLLDDLSCDVRRRSVAGFRTFFGGDVLQAMLALLSHDRCSAVTSAVLSDLVVRPDQGACEAVSNFLLSPRPADNELLAHTLHGIASSECFGSYEEEIIKLLSKSFYWAAFDKKIDKEESISRGDPRHVVATGIRALLKHGSVRSREVLTHFSTVTGELKVYTGYRGYWSFHVAKEALAALAKLEPQSS
jgi:hypothetical protein